MPIKDIEKKREYNRLRQQRIRAEKKGVVVPQPEPEPEPVIVVPQPIILNLITDEEYEFIENEIDKLFIETDKTTPSFAIADIINEDDNRYCNNILQLKNKDKKEDKKQIDIELKKQNEILALKYINYNPKINIELSNELFKELWKMRPQEENLIFMYGKLIPTPRRYKVFGKGYKFTGNKKNDVIKEIPEIILPYLNYINTLDDYTYNSILINWYEKHDYIGYHSDKEDNLIEGSHIYGISFGEERIMSFKNIETAKVIHYKLQNNSLICMKSGCQQIFEHSILKLEKYKGKRINITFRSII